MLLDVVKQSETLYTGGGCMRQEVTGEYLQGGGCISQEVTDEYLKGGG